MSEASIPAWKRAGLKQNKQAVKKEKAAYDPLKEGLKRAHESGETPKAAKPAKKLKVPKSERPAPTHELDQLAYLRQYAEDRDSWKFSKQKQNWILKHIFSDITEERYEQPLLEYVKGLQGSARNWAVEDSKRVLSAWNEFMKEDREKKEDQENTDRPEETKEEPKSGGADSNSAEKESGENQMKTKGPKSGPAPAKKVPAERMARRAQAIHQELTGVFIELELLDTTAPDMKL